MFPPRFNEFHHLPDGVFDAVINDLGVVAPGQPGHLDFLLGLGEAPLCLLRPLGAATRQTAAQRLDVGSHQQHRQGIGERLLHLDASLNVDLQKQDLAGV